MEVVDITDPALWPSLDALERYVPDDPAGSEYLRLAATAHMTDGRALTCWTYVYNADTEGYGDVPRRRLGGPVPAGRHRSVSTFGFAFDGCCPAPWKSAPAELPRCATRDDRT